MKKKTNTQILTAAHHDFNRALSRFAHLKIADSALSDDLVQTTFMKTWLYLRKNGKINQMRGFLYHVLNGLIIDEYRKNKTISLDILTDNGLELAIINSENLFNIIDAKSLVLLIKRLPIKYRKIINMRYLKEMSVKEMSIATNATQNAVSVQVHRGLAKLRLLAAGAV